MVKKGKSVTELGTRKWSWVEWFWLFVIGCFLGVMLEYSVILVEKLPMESRSGLVFGTFNVAYGVGLVGFTFLLRDVRNWFSLWLLGAGLGGVIEFILSWLQELVFGTVSWDYSWMSSHIAGRTSSQLMFYWGALGTVYIKLFLPKIIKLFSETKLQKLSWLTNLTLVFMIFNMTFSAAAVYRWHLRTSSGLEYRETFIDRHFHDDRMQKVYPNMRMVR